MNSEHNGENPNTNTQHENRAKPQKIATHQLNNIKKVIGVVSGKGGVGKSLVTSLLAIIANRDGYQTAIFDADITGPSIPRSFGLHEGASGNKSGIFPVETANGIRVMSLNLLTENETDPVLWRGPIVANAVQQFWTDVIWGDIDYMFIDMPPGTGDVALTVFQSLPLDGIIVVTSPQELVAMIVEKAINMAKVMNIPVLGIVENMSYMVCPHCQEKLTIFGPSKVAESAKKYQIERFARIPIDSAISTLVDQGSIEDVQGEFLDDLRKIIN
ncbi:MAG: Mrp/NBP35 family ATP-binding protein [Bacilli bacterium]|nr:Mrp/NBP35 family ATP-binding protein [Bacilli bacterium]